MDPISKHTHTDVNPQTKLQMVALSKECDSEALFLCVCACACVFVILNSIMLSLSFFGRFSPDCVSSDQGT